MIRTGVVIAAAVLGLGVVRAQVPVPIEAPITAKPTAVHDARYGVRFQVPAGWSFDRRDHQVSTFRLDARSASKRSVMRGVASIGFNPFPQSTFSGAWFYFSLQRHTNDGACARQAGQTRDSVSVGRMNFRSGHDEQAGMCVELRDEVYTAYRRGSCYRFDAAVRTFCAVSSGAQEMSDEQLAEIKGRMGGILDSVVFDWRPVGSGVVSKTANR